MKLLIQIPCLNEQDQLAQIINDIRMHVSAFDYEILVIDDGSTDHTIKVAQELKVEHIISLKRNMGLGYAFQAGLDFAKKKGYDYLINTDADNQYQSRYINALYHSILNSKSDIVIGVRDHD